MAAHARPLSIDDLGELTAIDAAYAAERGLEPLVSLASLHLYQRSGHAFVAHAGDGGAAGFVLAQAVWGGDRATVSVQRLALGSAAGFDVAVALVKAVTKSAYDAGVYQLEVALPAVDHLTRGALEAEEFAKLPSVVYARGLGSRAEAVRRAADANGGNDG